MTLYAEKVRKSMESFAAQLGYTPLQAASGIIDVVNAKMEQAIRVISIERGYDIREFALISFGGAGGLHACELARSLSIPVVIVPGNAGILSAFGMLVSDVVKSYSRTILLRAENTTYKEILETFKTMEKRAYSEMKAEGFRASEIIFQRSLDMRYEGQSYELNVPFDKSFLEHFNQIYARRFGYYNTKNVIELVNLRMNAVVPVRKPAFEKPAIHTPDPTVALIHKRPAIISGDACEVSVYDRELLAPGNIINGPAIIAEYSATTLIPAEFVCKVDEYGNMILRRAK